jgi:aldehyde:ferredoxin oxidoreductase
MGSKNLKAIVAHGDKPLAVADPGGLKLASAQVLEKISQKFITFRRLSAYGTAHLIHPFNQEKILPTRNFRTGDFEEWEKIDGETIFSSLVSKRTACFSCPIGCRRRSKVDGEFVEGPDFIDLVSFGSLCGNHDVRTIIEARRRSNELGLDPLSMGAAVASVMDLRDRGLLSDDEVGFPLGFGNSSGLMGLLAQAEKNEGLGRALAEDPFQIARNRSSHSIFHIRNQPIGPSHPLRDPLIDLHYRVSNSGTWYLLASGHFARELEIYDQFGVKDEVSRVRLFQDTMAVMESLGLCEYLLLFLNLKDIASLLSPILGVDVDPQGLLQLGGRISDLERQLNLDWDRNRNLTSAAPSWASEAKDERVSQYFSLRNWDEKGVPKGETEL